MWFVLYISLQRTLTQGDFAIKANRGSGSRVSIEAVYFGGRSSVGAVCFCSSVPVEAVYFTSSVTIGAVVFNSSMAIGAVRFCCQGWSHDCKESVKGSESVTYGTSGAR